jgi:hypothetical protein
MKAKLTTHRQKVIEKCYSSDEDLINIFHIIAPTTIKAAVIHTLGVFLQSENFKMYELTEKGAFVGYVGVSSNSQFRYVQGFFIMPEFRSKYIFSEFFKQIKHLCGESAYIPVYEKNTRANLFLTKNKCSFVQSMNDDKVGAKFNVYKLN